MSRKHGLDDPAAMASALAGMRDLPAGGRYPNLAG